MSYAGDAIARAAASKSRAETHVPRDLSAVSAADFPTLSAQDRNRLYVENPDRYRALRDGAHAPR
jgi:hypothetical protein